MGYKVVNIGNDFQWEKELILFTDLEAQIKWHISNTIRFTSDQTKNYKIKLLACGLTQNKAHIIDTSKIFWDKSEEELKSLFEAQKRNKNELEPLWYEPFEFEFLNSDMRKSFEELNKRILKDGFDLVLNSFEYFCYKFQYGCDASNQFQKHNFLKHIFMEPNKYEFWSLIKWNPSFT